MELTYCNILICKILIDSIKWCESLNFKVFNECRNKNSCFINYLKLYNIYKNKNIFHK